MRIRHLFAILILLSNLACASDDTVKIFPIEQYNQDINAWMQQSHITPNKALMTPEASHQHMQRLYDKTYGKRSPWSPDYVKHMLLIDSVSASQLRHIEFYQRHNKQCNDGEFDRERCFFAENFRLPEKAWYENLINNMKLTTMPLEYQAKSRAILVDNVELHKFPTVDKLFKGYKIAGEGYPFDDLIVTAEWIGTPVYILNTSRDKQWMLVLTPNATAWVKSTAVANASSDYIKHYQQHIKRAPIAFIQNDVSLKNQQDQYLATGHVGTILPQAKSTHQVLLPRKGKHGIAKNSVVNVTAANSAKMPLAATPQNIAKLISAELGRPYGWGGLHLYNDCSQALKTLFTPLGVWLPRHSSNQVEDETHIDLSDKDQEQRLAYLREHGEAFKTIIYINGHVMLYLGVNPDTKQVMTFQNTWALKPGDRSYRAVIGKAVLLPLLKTYPNDPKLLSQANLARFKIRTL